MKKYEDVVLDINGNAISGATVAVQSYPSGSSATVYPANTPTGGVTSVTTDSDGRFTFFAKNGRYNLVVSKSGITSETQTNVLIEEPVEVINVDGYGAVGDGSTDDTAAIQAAEDALTTNGGVLVFTPGKNYKFNSQLTKKSFVLWQGDGATLTWGGGATVAITSSTSGILERGGIAGLKIDFGTASKGLELFSPYQCVFRGLRLAGNSSTSFLVDVGVNTAGGTNADGNRNAAYNYFENVLQSGTCGTFIRLKGNSTSQVVTLNTFHHISAISCAVRGIDIAKWVDSNVWTGITRLTITANNAVGVEMNTDTPGSDLGVYANNFEHLAVDSFSALSGRVGLKINFADQNRVNYLFNDPAAEGGQYAVTANAGYDIHYAPASTNDVARVCDATTARKIASGSKTPYILGKSSAAVTAPLDTNTNTLATITVPAAAMGANGLLRIKALFNAATATTNRTCTIQFGGTAMCTKILSNEVDMLLEVEISNANSVSAQYGIPTFTTINGIQLLTPTTAAINTAAAADVTIKVTKATGADPLILKTYSVELVADGA